MNIVLYEMTILTYYRAWTEFKDDRKYAIDKVHAEEISTRLVSVENQTIGERSGRSNTDFQAELPDYLLKWRQNTAKSSGIWCLSSCNKRKMIGVAASFDKPECLVIRKMAVIATWPNHIILTDLP